MNEYEPTRLDDDDLRLLLGVCQRDLARDWFLQVDNMIDELKQLRAENAALRERRLIPTPCPDCGGTGIVPEPHVNPESRDVTVIGVVCERCGGTGRIADDTA